MTLVLSENLAPHLSQDCYHLADRGGTKACVMKIKQQVKDYRFVCRSDVNSYYATIDHKILLTQLAELISDTSVTALITNMLSRLDNVNGELYSAVIGISQGNPLSPLLGAIYLQAMDQALGDYCAKRGLRYYRYMDDWLILTKTRHQLRQVVRLMNQCLAAVKQTKHPFKTYIGRIKEDGFDFLGYRIIPSGEQYSRDENTLDLAWKTWANHFDKLQQLYEQGASQESIAGYVKRWLVWVRSGVKINLKTVIATGLDSDLGRALVRLHQVDLFYSV